MPKIPENVGPWAATPRPGSQRWRLLTVPVIGAFLLLFAGCGDEPDQPTATPLRCVDECTELKTETFELNGVTMTSHIVEVQTRLGNKSFSYPLTWHYVEAGEGEPIVFLHGLPESWYSWHYQLEDLAADYQVIAIDLKGYGQSDKSDGNYAADHVAEEVLALLDSIGLARFNLVTHDWGSLMGDFLAGRHPEWILRYVRMQAPVHKTDPKNHPQFVLFRDQEFARNLFADADAFVRRVYDQRTVQPVPEEDLRRIIEEFSRPGVAEAVPRYFRDVTAEMLQNRLALYAKMDFPVLLLQGERDPAQPQWYFEGATEQFPNAKLQYILDAGHFTELEQPEAVAAAIRDFLGAR